MLSDTLSSGPTTASTAHVPGEEGDEAGGVEKGSGSPASDEVIQDIKQAIIKGTGLWKANKRDECFTLYLKTCEDAATRLRTAIRVPVQDSVAASRGAVGTQVCRTLRKLPLPSPPRSQNIDNRSSPSPPPRPFNLLTKTITTHVPQGKAKAAVALRKALDSLILELQKVPTHPLGPTHPLNSIHPTQFPFVLIPIHCTQITLIHPSFLFFFFYRDRTALGKGGRGPRGHWRSCFGCC